MAAASAARVALNMFCAKLGEAVKIGGEVKVQEKEKALMELQEALLGPATINMGPGADEMAPTATCTSGVTSGVTF